MYTSRELVNKLLWLKREGFDVEYAEEVFSNYSKYGIETLTACSFSLTKYAGFNLGTQMATLDFMENLDRQKEYRDYFTQNFEDCIADLYITLLEDLQHRGELEKFHTDTEFVVAFSKAVEYFYNNL